MKNFSSDKQRKTSSKLIDEVEKRYGPKDWEQFDEIEEQNNREVISSEEVEDNGENEDNRKKKKHKQTKKEKKMTQISEYQDALRKLRKNSKQFRSPFDKQKINLDQMMNFMKLLQGAFDKEMNIEIALKSLGLKRLKILFKSGAHTNIGFVLNYLNSDGHIPKWLLNRHRDLMKNQGDEFCSTQNALLRTMSFTGNDCLKG